MPRLFAALELPHHAVMQLSLLRGGLPGARFVDPENYHLTLRFMGDMENHIADEVVAGLDRVKQRSFSFGINGLGVFGGKKPHSIFATPTPCPELLALHEEIERICLRLGLAPDSRKFTPHITIARLRNVSPENAAKYLSERGGFHIPQLQIKEFVLLSSRDSIGGGPYIREERYGLGTTYQNIDQNAISAL
ncbi:MAG: RNA 2',3'-cyclic phosphodiesterase [Pseudomonadota bacterium]